jgi:hypothetical protein
MSFVAPAPVAASIYTFVPWNRSRHALEFDVGRLVGTRLHSGYVSVNGTRRKVSTRRIHAALRTGLLRVPRTLHRSPGNGRPRRAGVKLVVIASCRPSRNFGPHKWPPACWRPYSGRSPFNRRISRNPVLAANSTKIVQRITGWGEPEQIVVGVADTRSDWNHPTYYSRRTDPRFVIRCLRYCGRPFPLGRDSAIKVNLDPRSRPASGTCAYDPTVNPPVGLVTSPFGNDCHLALVAPDGYEYAFHRAAVDASSRRIFANAVGRGPIRGSGCGGWGGTALECGNLAGVIRAPEMQEGQINHALIVAVRCTSGGIVYPGRDSTGSPCQDRANAPPIGARLQLAMSDTRLASLPVPAWKRTILRAFAHYGAYVGDTGSSSWGIAIESGSTYTSFGAEDAWVTFARHQRGGAVYHDVSERRYYMDLGSGVDWGKYLRVIDPCAARGSC